MFIHDALETSIVWEPLQEVLSRESLALALPGFGAELPSGFNATKDSYASWLETELTTIDGPIDLAGHGLGAVLGLRLVTARETSIRSWAVDAANVFHPATSGTELHASGRHPTRARRPWPAFVRTTPTGRNAGPPGSSSWVSPPPRPAL